jgi:hypothetical protein
MHRRVCRPRTNSDRPRHAAYAQQYKNGLGVLTSRKTVISPRRTIVAYEFQTFWQQADHLGIEPSRYVHAWKSAVHNQNTIQLSAFQFFKKLGTGGGLGLNQISEGGKRLP